MRLLPKQLTLVAVSCVALALGILLAIGPELRGDAVDAAEGKLASDAGLAAGTVRAYLETREAVIEKVAAAPELLNPAVRTQFLRKRESQLSPLIEGFYFHPLDGYAVPTVGRRFYVGDRDYYRRVLEGIPVVGVTLKSRFTHKWVFLIVLPIRDAKGKLVAALGATTEVGGLKADLDRARPAGDSWLAVVDRLGQPLISSPAIIASRLPRLGQAAPEYVSRNIAIGGQNYVVSGVQEATSRWTILCGLNVRQAQASANRAVERAELVVLAIFAIAALAAALFAKAVTRPVDELMRAMKAFQGGDMSARASPSSRDEIADLALGFNAMADAVESERRSRADAYGELERSKSLLQSVMDFSESYILIKDLAGKYILANRAAETLIGRPIVGEPVETVFPASYEAVEARDREVAETGTSITYDEIFEVEAGSSYQIVSKFPIRDAAGKIVAIGVVATDYTLLKAARSALHQNQDLLDAILNSAPVCCWVSDPKGTPFIANAECASRFGEVIGRSLEELTFLGEAGRSQIRAATQAAFGGQTSEFDLSISGREYRTLLSPVWSDASVIGAVAVALDVTDVRRYHRELLILNSELESRVQQRTKQLEQANADLEAFSYSVSHDLRAPVRAVLGFAQILRSEMGDHPVLVENDYLDRIERAGRRMGELIDGLLAMARAGKGKIERTKVDLSQLASESIEELVDTASEPKPTYEIHATAPAWCDPGLIRQVVTNLVDNALKYRRPDTPQHLIFGSEMTERGRAYFVQDRGMGIRAGDVERVFRPFERGAQSGAATGSGIGLSTVQRIVEAHGGQVWLRSQEGVGTTVYFTLDAAEANAASG